MRKAGTSVLVLAALILVGLVAPASAITIRDDRTQDLYLNLGAGPQYACVGRVDDKTASGDWWMGSGTLIAPGWVLTAAHMIEPDTTSLTFTVGGGTYAAAQWFVYPRWTGDLLAGYDIGLMKLQTTVDGITPAARYTGTGEFGRVGTMVGFGMTGTGLTGAIDFDEQKRGGQNMIDAYYGRSQKTSRILLVDFDNPHDPGDSRYGSATPLDLEGIVAPGDSGGGLFIGDGLLAGVTSFIGAFDGDPDSDYGDVGGFTRVSAFNDWIDSTMSGGRPKPRPPKAWGWGHDSLAAIPEPASLALLAFGAAVLAVRRKR